MRLRNERSVLSRIFSLAIGCQKLGQPGWRGLQCPAEDAMPILARF